MTVCRYFLQGNCRFGERCRNEHTDYAENFNRKNDYGFQDRYRQQQYDHNVSYGPRRSTSNERYNQQQRYNSPERYNQQEGYNSPERYEYNEPYHSNYRNQQPSSYNEFLESYQYTPPVQYGSDSNYYKNKYGNSKHEWMSDEYRKQLENNAGRNKVGSFFNTSTLKSKVNFSFKDPGPSIVKDHPVDLNMNEKNITVAEGIKSDITECELGNQWPFSYYFPIQGKSAFPGFIDVSPEEMRHEAYKAKENNTYNSYIKSEKKAFLDLKNKRDEMKEPSLELMLIISKIRKGENLSSDFVDGGNYLSKFNETVLEDMISEEQPTPSKNSASSFSFKTTLDTDDIVKSTASSFSFKTTLETDNIVKSSASSFSFKLPSETDSKQSFHASNYDIYTPMEKISLQDKEQFLASTFTLGKIPTVPPPQEMCI